MREPTPLVEASVGRPGREGAGWHSLEPEQVPAALDTSLESGLSGAEAARRLARYGPNELAVAGAAGPWKLLLAQFRNVLLLILLVAVGLSLALGHVTEAAVIAAIVALAALLGFVQEYRAERALEALRRLAAPTATVLRDGEEVDVAARELVPGDVLLVRAGARISADARVVEAVNLQVEESPLTGESVPVTKTAAALPSADLPPADRVNMLYAGTTATYGRGRAVVVATGMAPSLAALPACSRPSSERGRPSR